MRKLKLALVLPIAQVVIAAILLQWGYRAPTPRGSEFYEPTASLICRGLNAPALLFRVLTYYLTRSDTTLSWVSRSILGFHAGDLVFLAGVIVVWYFVGWALDHRRTVRTLGRGAIVGGLIAHSLVLGLGGILFSSGLYRLKHPTDNPLHPVPVEALLTLIWAISLLFISGRGLVRAIRHALCGSA